jgi:hypothetical protein
MNATTFNIEKAKIIENAVFEEFGCSVRDIICYKDTFFKKVVVFLLVKIHDYNSRNVGMNYQMSYLYVPTVVAEIERDLNEIEVLRIAIEKVYKKLGYEVEKMDVC